MRPVEEVRRSILSVMRPMGVETVDFRDSLGRVLAEPVVATHDVPPFPNSSMDGFAVRSADVSQPGAVLEVVDDLPAGQVARVGVGEGQALKIMTGAPMPEGADAVVRVEDTVEEGGKVRVETTVGPGNYVRRAGGDIADGQTVFAPGTRIGPMHVGVLATIGHVSPLVSRRPRVAVMSTGDELTAPETADLDPGMIRDSNRPMLTSMLAEAGVDVIDMGRIPDDADQLRAALGEAAVVADAIVSSGGVSMGDYDVTKLVLRDRVEFMQVAMSPGKPLAFGLLGGTPFWGLPGNPVSVLVSFEQFARPALLRMQGATRLLRPRVGGIAGEDLSSDPAKVAFIRVVVSNHDTMEVVQTGGQDSNVLSGTANADGFAVIPTGIETVPKGSPVMIELFRSPETRGVDGV